MRIILSLIFVFFVVLSAGASDPMALWPKGAPGEKGDIGPERTNLTKPDDKGRGGKPLMRIVNVSIPTLTLYQPSGDKNTGAAVVVCPGGGYGMLALDLEELKYANGSIQSA